MLHPDQRFFSMANMAPKEHSKRITAWPRTRGSKYSGQGTKHSLSKSGQAQGQHLRVSASIKSALRQPHPGPQLRDMEAPYDFHAFVCVAVTCKEVPRCKLMGNIITLLSLKDQNFIAGSSLGKGQFPGILPSSKTALCNFVCISYTISPLVSHKLGLTP